MVQAYILIKVEAGKTKDIMEQLRSLPAVERAHSVTGPTDLIAVVVAEDARALADLVFRSVQTISGVKETDTRIVVDG
jgi:DNA-binding Lrp family transcriptional regulator